MASEELPPFPNPKSVFEMRTTINPVDVHQSMVEYVANLHGMNADERKVFHKYAYTLVHPLVIKEIKK